MHANDRQAGSFMLLIPIPQLRQLIQPYVQNSTTRPFKASIVSGLLLIQASPEMTGAGAPMTEA
jgi:hypothetical protein